MKRILWKGLFAAALGFVGFLQPIHAEESQEKDFPQAAVLNEQIPYGYAGMEAGRLLDFGTGTYIYEYGMNSVTIEYQGQMEPAILMEMFLHGERVYCIEPEVHTQAGEGYSPGIIDQVMMPEEQRRLGLIAYYGYGYADDFSPEMSAATMIAIWMERGRKVYDVKESVMAKVRILQERVDRADIRPSFAGQQLMLNGYGKEHALMLSDQNHVLSEYALYDNGGYHIEKNKDDLLIWRDSDVQADENIVFDRIPRKDQGTSIVYVSANDRQKLMRIYPQSAESVQLALTMAPAALRICKQDEDGAVIGNAVFEISYHEDMSNPLGTFTTDAEGYAEIPQLEPRAIYIRELSVPEPYEADDTIEKVDLIADETVIYTKVNHFKRGDLHVLKADDEGTAIQGVVFELSKDSSFQSILATGATDENGCLTFASLRYGTYYIREKETGEQYVLDDTVHEIHIQKEREKLHLINDLRRSSIKLKKLDESTLHPLENVEFTLYDSFGNILDVCATDKQGIVEFSNLKNGVYYVKETKALSGYAPLSNRLRIDISGNDEGRVYEYELTNAQIVETGLCDRRAWYILGLVLSYGILRRFLKKNTA